MIGYTWYAGVFRFAILLPLLLPLPIIPFIVAEFWITRPAGFLSGFDVLVFMIRPLLVGAMTILGILSRTLHDELVSDQKDEPLRSFIKRTLSSRSLWTSIIVSPIVILSLYKNIAEIRSDVLVALMAYENGFFFRSILKRKME